ncbi:type II toxin-antitoxin system RelE/ParE family toxin [Parasegetibacter sp. NRK P23]|uniref:type II toxin-antitoxin system RelE/ParE family toxin n=1 Tax=Parasegetibacter sp. NRK P23 TaxID=2942999 RepID=UPI002043C08D|nr:type II toxin-antitoxin system RelE/ParE family toxin [Parasegetibacter sp. NRK P23]MCM5527370.1 type II toxin-antitoxin system RelE/ParE family toxin [Parasegetibacter sp. NRK P23]
MKITFADKKLEKLVNDDRKMLRELGKLRAEKIKARLAQLRFATTLEDVRYLPGNYHELTSNRKGKWACDLDQPYRLVFTPHENPIPTNEDGQYIWLEIAGVEVIEIINYHKEK